MVLVKGQFASPDEFGAIVLRANTDGSAVRLRDVARIEVGGLSYQFTTRRNGEPAAGLTVLLAPTANALATATAVKAKMEALSKFFPANIKYDISYDITPVVMASIKKVLMTLVEAVVLVFLVMLLFLQNIRYTIIPTIVVPVALLGTCAHASAAADFPSTCSRCSAWCSRSASWSMTRSSWSRTSSASCRRRGCRRARRPARRWGRSPARSSASRWC